jgi:hypothetical protein
VRGIRAIFTNSHASFDSENAIGVEKYANNEFSLLNSYLMAALRGLL